MPAKKTTPKAASPAAPAERIPTPDIRPDRPFECPMLSESNPRDFLAALGLLQLAHGQFPDHGFKLSWSGEGHPILSAEQHLPPTWFSTLCDSLRHLNEEKPHPIVHNKVIRGERPVLQSAIHRALDRWNTNAAYPQLPTAFYAACASQIHTDKDNGLDPTAFSFANAQAGKELLRDIQQLIAAEGDTEHFAFDFDFEAHPLRKRDAKSFRWHPAEYRAAAYRSHDPGANVKGDSHLDFPTANILAFFGMLSYPVVDRSHASVTLGIVSSKPDRRTLQHFTWPIWYTPLSLAETTSLLHHPEVLTATPQSKTLAAMGVYKIWRSLRFSADKSLYFAPAEAII